MSPHPSPLIGARLRPRRTLQQLNEEDPAYRDVPRLTPDDPQQRVIRPRSVAASRPPPPVTDVQLDPIAFNPDPTDDVPPLIGPRPGTVTSATTQAPDPRLVGPRPRRVMNAGAAPDSTSGPVPQPVNDGEFAARVERARQPGYVSPEIGPRPGTAPPATPGNDPQLIGPHPRRMAETSSNAVTPAMPQPAGMPALIGERPRRVTQPDQLEVLSDYLDQLERMPVEDRNGRGRSFWANFFRALAPSMNRAQAMAASQGRAVSWGDLFTGIAGAGGAGVAGIITPRSDEWQARASEIERTHGSLSKLLARHKAIADVRRQVAEIGETKARTADLKNKPERERREAEAKALKERVADLVTMHGRAGRYNPDDPHDRSSQALKQEVERLRRMGADVELIPYQGKESKPERFKINGYWYTMGGDGAPQPLMVNGKHAADMADVADEEGIRPGTRLTANALAGQREYQRGRDAEEDQYKADERGYQRQRDALADERRAVERQEKQYEDDRRHAGNLVTKFEGLKGAASAAFNANDKNKGNAKLAEARNIASQLKESYGHHYEVGESNGWPYVKPKPRPQFTPRQASPNHSQGSYQGRVSRAKFRNQNPRYKDADDATVDAAIHRAGYLPY